VNALIFYPKYKFRKNRKNRKDRENRKNREYTQYIEDKIKNIEDRKNREYIQYVEDKERIKEREEREENIIEILCAIVHIISCLIILLSIPKVINEKINSELKKLSKEDTQLEIMAEDARIELEQFKKYMLVAINEYITQYEKQKAGTELLSFEKDNMRNLTALIGERYPETVDSLHYKKTKELSLHLDLVKKLEQQEIDKYQKNYNKILDKKKRNK
jgi:hypothetical protein